MVLEKKSVRTDGRTYRRTTDNKRSEKLTWAFSLDDLETRVVLLTVARNIDLYGYLRGLVTLPDVVERLALKLSLPVLKSQARSVTNQNRMPLSQDYQLNHSCVYIL